MVKKIKTNQTLALELWETENFDTQMLTTLVIKPKGYITFCSNLDKRNSEQTKVTKTDTNKNGRIKYDYNDLIKSERLKFEFRLNQIA